MLLELYQASTAPCWSQRKPSPCLHSVMSSLCTLCTGREGFFKCLCSYVQNVHVYPLSDAFLLKTCGALLQRHPRNWDRVYLIAGQNMWCHYGITKPVTPLHYRAQHNTPYASTQAARVTATDHHSPLFKPLSCKHTASLWLHCLSSRPPSDCCGEVFFREYHPPNIDTHTHKHTNAMDKYIYIFIYIFAGMQT